MGTHLIHTFRRRTHEAESRPNLVVCSICLRVHVGAKWVEAERVIRELRSYELETPPRLSSAVCDDCAESIFLRRETDEPMAA
jgi:NMD protein affecting ribosome stability and mRNA decay